MGIVAKNIEFLYRKNRVLKGVDFRGNEGSLICVIGKNGAGKTTLFRTILGGLKSYKGEISINGSEISSLKEKELAKLVAYVPQNYIPTYDFTVLDMVLMGVTPTLGLFEMPSEKHRVIALQALDKIGMKGFADRKFTNISGGERQMVLIARAMAQSAKIIIMDEPCSSLDYGNGIRVMKLCKSLVEEGYLIIQSTHSPEHVFMYADEVMVLQDGKVAVMGKPSEVLREDILKAVYGINLKLYSIENLDHQICIPN